MNRLFTAFIVGAMVLGVGVGWVLNQSLAPADAKSFQHAGEAVAPFAHLAEGNLALDAMRIAIERRRAVRIGGEAVDDIAGEIEGFGDFPDERLALAPIFVERAVHFAHAVFPW